MITKDEITAARIGRMGAEAVALLAGATVGIAGLGGLGSHMAVLLARMGVGRLVLADFDRVDLTNLHRQRYDLAHVGLLKTEAILSQLKAVDPYLSYEIHPCRITPENAPAIFGGCAVVCEAFDRPGEKAMLTETLLAACPAVKIVSGSGMAGTGSANAVQTRRVMGRLYLCGDGITDVDTAGSLAASRVAVCAAHQAHMALRLLLGQDEP